MKLTRVFVGLAFLFMTGAVLTGLFINHRPVATLILRSVAAAGLGIAFIILMMSDRKSKR